MDNFFREGHALIVGAGDDLPNTVKDAEALNNILLDERRCSYNPGQVSLLTDRDADRDAVIAGLKKLSQAADENSSVVVYFSGHGQRVSAAGSDSFYLMPYGYDMDRLEDTAVHESEFVGLLRDIKARKLLLLLDCCHAGRLREIDAPKAKSPRAGVKAVKSPLPPEALSLLSEGAGRAIITSSTGDEESLTGDPYSAFTAALIEGLCGARVGKRDGYVRVSDLALYARERVAQLTGGKQHPDLNWEEGTNFRVAYYAGGGVEPAPPPAVPRIEPEPGAWKFDNRGQIIIAGEYSVFNNKGMKADKVYQVGGDAVFNEYASGKDDD